MTAKKAGELLIETLKKPAGDLTIADASIKSGLSLREAEMGLHYLVAEYRGHLSATNRGELLFRFPTGFTKPWEKIEKLEVLWQKVQSVTLGIAKFVVRAWISIVMVAYVAIFAAIVIGLSFAKSSDRDDRNSFGGTLLLHTLFRVVLDSLFWTFHPFSPYYVRYDDAYGYSYERRKKQIPFYEKVNRFFFGPAKPALDPLEATRIILEEIRYQKGRIGLLDVMRVTGFSRDKTDALMAKLMLEYEGDVLVTEAGAIIYSFPEIRKTAQDRKVEKPISIWLKLKKITPFTGNSAGSNFLIAGLNGFNLLMSVVAISSGWTLEKLHWMFTAGSYAASHGGLLPPMPSGTPLLLGWIPFWFSLALFSLPIMRWLRRKSEQKKINHENGRLGLFWGVLNGLTSKGIKEVELKMAWKKTAGVKPEDKELTQEVIKLGGELEIDENGEIYYRFRELEAEVVGLENERKKARDFEKEVGEVVYSSMN